MAEICGECRKTRALHVGASLRCPGMTTRFLEASCPYPVRKATMEKVGLLCGKKTDGETIYCPKHRVMTEGAPLENQKKMQKLRDRKGFIEEMRKALETSPLSGYNPEVDKKRRSTYSV